MLEPPAARPAGERGPRGPLSALAAAAGVIALALAQYADDPGWTAFVYGGAALAFAVAAVLLWLARRRLVLLGVPVLVAAAIAGWVYADQASRDARAERDRWAGSVWTPPRRGPVLGKARAEAVPLGLTRRQIVARLGPTKGHGIQRLNGEPDMRCLAYRAGRDPSQVWAFCFRDGRYEALRRW